MKFQYLIGVISSYYLSNEVACKLTLQPSSQAYGSRIGDIKQNAPRDSQGNVVIDDTNQVNGYQNAVIGKYNEVDGNENGVFGVYNSGQGNKNSINGTINSYRRVVETNYVIQDGNDERIDRGSSIPIKNYQITPVFNAKNSTTGYTGIRTPQRLNVVTGNGNVVNGYSNVINGYTNVVNGNENSVDGNKNLMVASGQQIQGNGQIIIRDNASTERTGRIGASPYRLFYLNDQNIKFSASIFYQVNNWKYQSKCKQSTLIL